MDHFEDCLRCGMPFDTAVEADTTLQLKEGQVCIHDTPNGAWVFIHRVGGGKRE